MIKFCLLRGVLLCRGIRPSARSAGHLTVPSFGFPFDSCAVIFLLNLAFQGSPALIHWRARPRKERETGCNIATRQRTWTGNSCSTWASSFRPSAMWIPTMVHEHARDVAKREPQKQCPSGNMWQCQPGIPVVVVFAVIIGCAFLYWLYLQFRPRKVRAPSDRVLKSPPCSRPLTC